MALHFVAALMVLPRAAAYGTAVTSRLWSSRRTPIARAGHVLKMLDPQSDALVALGGALTRVSEQQADEAAGWTRNGRAWVLLPPATPWAVVHFVGGAGFGSAPQLCYDALLSGLVRRLGVAVIATPYDVGTDHWALSRAVHRDFDAALDAVRERSGLSLSAPTLRLGHSLGGKLLVLASLGDESSASIGVLSAGEEGTAGEEEADVYGATGGASPSPSSASSPAQSSSSTAAAAGEKLGLLAFNNFALSDSAALAASFLSRMQGGGARQQEIMSQVMDAFNMAQAFATAAGADFGASLEVSPTPAELDRAVANRYDPALETTLLSFAGDALDSSEGLLDALPPTARVARSTLDDAPTGHLTPVCFSLQASDVDPTLAMLIGDRGFTFGDPAACEPLVDALCEWAWPSGMAAPTSRVLGAGEQ